MPYTESSALRGAETLIPIATEVCPVCDQPIPPDKLVEIQQRERERGALQAKQLRATFERDKAVAIAAKQSELDHLREDAAAATARAKQESEKREAAAREAARKEAEAAMSDKLAAASQEKAAAVEQLKTVTAQQERMVQERLQAALVEQRSSLETASAQALLKEQSKAFKERQKVQAKLEDLQRQLQKKRADELGESAELDLGSALRAAFPDDRFQPIDKGVAGADLWQDVVHNGDVCGRIIYDSKNRKQWRDDYVAKLKTDQLDADGDCAVLATRVFPKGITQMHIQDGVVLAHPARVVVLATLLRDQIIQTRRLELSDTERDAKSSALYDFITSERCRQLFDHFETLTSDLLDLDVAEQKLHHRTWKRRGQLIKKSERTILVQLRDEIDGIIDEQVVS